MSNFFIDNIFTRKQISAINNLKGKNNAKLNQGIKGDSVSIFDDINSWENGNKTNNTDLLDYIDKNFGMENFLSVIDADGNGKISKKEASVLSNYDGDSALTSTDVNNIFKDVKALKSAKSTQTNRNITTEYTYTTDSTGKLITKSATSKNNKTNKITATYAYDTKGNIKTKVDKVKNTTIEYVTDANGNKVSSKIYANNKSKTLKSEFKYDDKGRVKSEIRHISSSTGTKSERFCTFTYDDKGRVTGRKEYDKEGGKLLADFEFTRDENGRIISRLDKLTKATKTYEYDKDGNLAKAIFKNKDGKTTAVNEYNEDGTYANQKTDKYFYIFEYDEAGIRTKSKKYDIASIDSNNQPKKDAKPIEEKSYEEGVEKSKVTRDKDSTNYYKDGKLQAKTEGDFTYVYQYDKNGKLEKTLKYNKSDCINGVPKQNAKPITSDEAGKDIVNFAQKFVGYNGQDHSADIFVKGVGDDSSKVAWCSEFAKYVLQNSGHYDEVADWYKNLPNVKDSGKNAAGSIQSAAKSAGAIVSAQDAKSGYIVLFDRNGDGSATHTALVRKVENGKLYTIEGNVGGRVKYGCYDANSKQFIYCKVLK